MEAEVIGRFCPHCKEGPSIDALFLPKGANGSYSFTWDRVKEHIGGTTGVELNLLLAFGDSSAGERL